MAHSSAQTIGVVWPSVMVIKNPVPRSSGGTRAHDIAAAGAVATCASARRSFFRLRDN